MATTFTATDAAGYELMMGRWSRRLAPMLVDFAGLTPGARVLDVGCGTGSLTRALAARSEPSSIAGFDLAEPFVAYAKAEIADPRVTLRVADVCELPYEADSFDAALSLLVLQFVPDTGRALAELQRVVRSGGTIAAVVWDHFGGMPHMRMLFDTAAALVPDVAQARDLFRPLSGPGELAAAWRDAGLTTVEERTLMIRFEFERFDDYWRPFLTLNGPAGRLLADLSDTDRRRVEAAVRNAYLGNRPDGARSFVGIAWACRGTVA